MRRTFIERFIVGLSDRLFNSAADFMEEVILPFSLLSRWVRGSFPCGWPWTFSGSAWAPFRRYRRWQGRRLGQVGISRIGEMTISIPPWT